MRKVIAAFGAVYPVDKVAPDPMGLMLNSYVVTLCVCDDGTCFQLRQAEGASGPDWVPFPSIPLGEAP